MAQAQASLPLLFDIWERIFEFLEEDSKLYKKTLANCGLANHALLSISRPLLLREYTLDLSWEHYQEFDQSSARSFTNLFNDRPDLQAHVRHLTLLVAGFSTDESDVDFQQLLQLLPFPSIRSVHIDISMRWDISSRDGGLLVRLLSSPTITSISIDGDWWVRVPPSILLQSGQVEKLTLQKSQFEEVGALRETRHRKGEWIPYAFDFPRLTHLTFDAISGPVDSFRLFHDITRGAPNLTSIEYSLPVSISPRDLDGAFDNFAKTLVNNCKSLSCLNISICEGLAKSTKLHADLRRELLRLLLTTPDSTEILLLFNVWDSQSLWKHPDWDALKELISDGITQQPSRNIRMRFVSRKSLEI